MEQKKSAALRAALRRDSHAQYSTLEASATRPINVLLPLLDSVKTTGPGRWIARCPGHYDRHPSLSVRELPDGMLLLRDWAGCSVADILMACGLELRDLFPQRIQGRGPLRRGERWIPGDVLRCVAREAVVVLCAAEAVRRGDALTDDDMRRLAMAVGRLHDAADLVLGPRQETQEDAARTEAAALRLMYVAEGVSHG